MLGDNAERLLKGEARESLILLCAGSNGVAHLRLLNTDYPWVEYSFSDLADWDGIGPQKSDLSMTSRSGMDGIDRIVSAIVDLDLWLVSDDIRVGNFLMHIRDNTARVRSYPRGGKVIRS